MNLIVKTYDNDTIMSNELLDGIFSNNILKYHTKEDDFEIDLDNKTLSKTNPESIFSIAKNLCTIKLLGLDLSYDIDILRYNFLKENNTITIEYRLISQDSNFKISIEMSDE